jgi:hypothetical protein
MRDLIAEAADEAERMALTDGTAFELSVLVHPRGFYLRALPEKALELGAKGFDARQHRDTDAWIDPVTRRQLVAVQVGNLATAPMDSNRAQQTFAGTYRVGILKEGFFDA